MYIFNIFFFLILIFISMIVIWFSVGIWYILFFNDAIIIIYSYNIIFYSVYSVPNLPINIKSIEL